MRRLLAPRSSRLLGYSELWLEDEHLLYVTSSRFTERYRRFDLNDIQAFVWTQFPLWHPARTGWLAASIFFTAILLLIMPGNWKWMALPFAVSLAFAIVSVAKGARSRLVLHTAVTTIPIDAIDTVERAQAVLPELRQLIEGKQGQLSSDGHTVLPPPSQPAPLPPAPPPSTLLQQVLFGMLLVHSLLLALLFALNKMDSGLTLSATLLLAELALSVLGVIRWRGAGVVVATVCGIAATLALLDSGVLTYTMGKSMVEFFNAAQQGRKPDEIEWLWLREQTVLRAGWHAIAGIMGWAAVLIRKGGVR